MDNQHNINNQDNQFPIQQPTNGQTLYNPPTPPHTTSIQKSPAKIVIVIALAVVVMAGFVFGAVQLFGGGGDSNGGGRAVRKDSDLVCTIESYLGMSRTDRRLDTFTFRFTPDGIFSDGDFIREARIIDIDYGWGFDRGDVNDSYDNTRRGWNLNPTSRRLLEAGEMTIRIQGNDTVITEMRGRSMSELMRANDMHPPFRLDFNIDRDQIKEWMEESGNFGWVGNESFVCK